MRQVDEAQRLYELEKKEIKRKARLMRDRLRSRQYYKDHRANELAKAKARRDANPEYMREWRRRNRGSSTRWYRLNKERGRAYAVAQYWKHRKKILARNSAWYHADPVRREVIRKRNRINMQKKRELKP